MLGILDRFRRL